MRVQTQMIDEVIKCQLFQKLYAYSKAGSISIILAITHRHPLPLTRGSVINFVFTSCVRSLRYDSPTPSPPPPPLEMGGVHYFFLLPVLEAID